jgi:hypothetical protein
MHLFCKELTNNIMWAKPSQARGCGEIDFGMVNDISGKLQRYARGENAGVISFPQPEEVRQSFSNALDRLRKEVLINKRVVVNNL